MVRSASLASLALLSLALPAPARAAGGEVPPEPGVYWETQVEMQMAGFSMPAQTSKVCLPKKGAEEPPSRDDPKCKVTDLKRTSQRMTWKMSCQDGTTGEGDITWAKDAYDGTMTMRTQGQEMRAKMKGKKVGGDCDANEMKRKVAGMQKQAEDAQAQGARAEKEACAKAAEGMKLGSFVNLTQVPTLPVQCKDPAQFCANAETRTGLVAFREGPWYDDANRAKVEKLCKKDLASTVKKHCAEAQKTHEKKTRYDDTETLGFVSWYCPDLAKTLMKRECAGRNYTSMPQAQRAFCTRWKEMQLAGGEEDRGRETEPAPAAASGKYMKSGIPDVDEPQQPKAKKKAKKSSEEDADSSGQPKEPEDMKSKIMKGLFGR